MANKGKCWFPMERQRESNETRKKRPGKKSNETAVEHNWKIVK